MAQSQVHSAKQEKKFMDAFTTMNAFTRQYANEIHHKNKKQTVIYPVLSLIAIFFVVTQFSTSLMIEWPFYALPVVAVVVFTYVGTKFMSWVSFKIYEYFDHRYVPTFFYWFFSFIFGAIITGLVVISAMYVFIGIALVVGLIVTILLGR